MLCAAEQAPPAREELPGFTRRFSEGTGPYTVSLGVPINATDRNPPFLTNQDWHISTTYDVEKLAEIGAREKLELEAVVERTDDDRRCGRLLANPRCLPPCAATQRHSAAHGSRRQVRPVRDEAVHAARGGRVRG